MARLVWTERGVRYFDPNPEKAAVVEISFGKMRSAARVIIRRRRGGQGGQPVEEEEEVHIVKSSGRPASVSKVRRNARNADNRSSEP